MNVLKCNISEKIHHKCCNNACYSNHVISVDDVVNGVKHLKHGKKDGSLGQSSDHILYASKTFFIQLSIVLTGMLRHGFSPDNLVLSRVISIPKNKKKFIK